MQESPSGNTDGSAKNQELWNVLDFARRYRLVKSEENRLLALFGTMASPRDLLLSARRSHPLS
jgi:hypothetical protein